MPPKPKFTKEEIVDAALDLVSEGGIEALTSRDLAARLGSSARPIFTIFKNMEEVQQEVRVAANKRFESYAKRAMQYTPVFKQMGMQVLLFAVEEPKLYRFLFMEGSGEPQTFESVFCENNSLTAECMEIIQKDYALTPEETKAMFKHVWIFTFGIGALCATGVCKFTDEELNELLGQDFMAMLMRIKSGAFHEPTVHPALNEMDQDK
ncbi:MAG: TetR/AcrR family transcriptional regulator [Lachnospiraceae bacterium]